MNENILSSTASTAVSGTNLAITPANAMTPENEQGVKLLITNGTPTAGASMPVVVTLGGAAIPVYDKYGNIVYGNQLYNGIVIKGYYGNNGAGNTPHYQLIKLPIRCYCS